MGGIVLARIAACVLTVGAFASGHVLRTSVVRPTETVALDEIPYEVGPWRGEDLSVRPQVMDLLRPDGFLLREYRTEGEPPMQIYVDYHRVQRLGATIHSPRLCYPGAGWQPARVDVTTVRGDGWERPACWLRLRANRRELLALYWYESRWGRSAREIDLKLGIVRSAFVRQPSDAALVRFATPLVDGDVDAARRRIIRFIDLIEPEVARTLPFGRGAR
jgi:EpsI family protein